MSEIATQDQSLPWLENDKKDLKALTDSSIEAVSDATQAVKDVANDVIEVTAETLAEVTVDHHHVKKAGMPQLDPTWFASQLFWLFVCFTVLYILMARGIIPRIREVLESRQSRIDSDLEFARSMQEESETVKSEYEASLDASQAKVRELIHNAQVKAEELAQARSKEMDAQIQALSDASEEEIKAQVKQVEKDILPAVEELAGMVVEKIMLKAADTGALKDSTKSELKSLSLGKV